MHDDYEKRSGFEQRRVCVNLATLVAIILVICVVASAMRMDFVTIHVVNNSYEYATMAHEPGWVGLEAELLAQEIVLSDYSETAHLAARWRTAWINPVLMKLRSERWPRQWMAGVQRDCVREHLISFPTIITRSVDEPKFFEAMRKCADEWYSVAVMHQDETTVTFHTNTPESISEMRAAHRLRGMQTP